MFTLIILLLIAVAISHIIRHLIFPRRHRFHNNRNTWGWNRYGGPNYNPYLRPRFGGLASILLLGALDRLFGRRW